ncbi:MAG: hypothetical protein JO112_14750 [Planctomycetes bacterium]|nr:hypothetical protein [Planctomycetota bacterium]
MKRAWILGWALVLAVGCQLPPERMPLQPLPQDTPPLPYAELLTRARMEASAATEAFYVSRWSDLEDAARGLQQTAQFLNRAIEVPVQHKATLTTEAKDLEVESGKLLEAAKAKEVQQTNDVLQRVNLRVRALRLED